MDDNVLAEWMTGINVEKETHQWKLLWEDIVSKLSSKLLDGIGTTDIAMDMQRHLIFHPFPLGHHVIPL